MASMKRTDLDKHQGKKLVGAISSPPADWDAWLKQTAADLQAEVEKLKAKG